MELTEPLETINKNLRNLFGVDTITGAPIWRVVWSEDQLEKRLMDTSDKGIFLLVPEVREVPKYRQWIREKFVLERLTIVPEINKSELPTQKLSYEPIYVFETKQGKPLPPKTEVAKFVIDCLYAAMGKSSLQKYVDPDIDPESHEARVQRLQNEMFGNETMVGDALAHKEAVIVPNKEFR
jgi:hypothetical protein